MRPIDISCKCFMSLPGFNRFRPVMTMLIALIKPFAMPSMYPATAFTTVRTTVLKPSNFLYATTMATPNATIPAVIATAGFSIMAAFTARIEPAKMPMPTMTAVNNDGFSCAQSANLCTTGSSFSMIGRNACPMDSLVSPKAMPSFFMPPAAVFAAASPAPPKFLVKTSCTSDRLAPSLIMALISGLSAPNAFMLPA